MLNQDGIKARYIFALCFFLASGSGMVGGLPATLCGIMGCIELSSALLGFSPLHALVLVLLKNRKIQTSPLSDRRSGGQ